MGKAVESSQWLSLIASFALVLVLLLGTLWVLRRIGAAGLRSHAGRRLAVVESLWLGNRQRVVLLKVDGREMLLGITAQCISRLDTTAAASSQPSDVPAAFALPDNDSGRSGVAADGGPASPAEAGDALRPASADARKRFLDAMRSIAGRSGGDGR